MALIISLAQFLIYSVIVVYYFLFLFGDSKKSKMKVLQNLKAHLNDILITITNTRHDEDDRAFARSLSKFNSEILSIEASLHKYKNVDRFVDEFSEYGLDKSELKIFAMGLSRFLKIAEQIEKDGGFFKHHIDNGQYASTISFICKGGKRLMEQISVLEKEFD